MLGEDGLFAPRSNNGSDFYVFAYGKNYRETLRAFYSISSPTPIIPRFALGVWWSRYHAYTQQEYLDLMKRFKKEDIPITVATVDMDWHWVKDIDKRFGVKYNGWTGYSWNTELFPDYREFLRELKADNLHITLNLHPADGVFCYEDMYSEMAKANGIVEVPQYEKMYVVRPQCFLPIIQILRDVARRTIEDRRALIVERNKNIDITI